MEKLPSGFSSGVQRCARCRWRGECQHSGKRSAADRTVLSGTGYGACGQSAAAELPCGKHGVLHQHPAGAFGNVPCHGCVAAQGACLGWADFCSAVRAAKSGNGSAGPFCTAVGPAAYRRRAGDRAGSERYGRSISCRNAAAQKQSGFCGTCRDRGRIPTTVSAASAPFAIPCRMQASVRPCGEPALSGAV